MSGYPENIIPCAKIPCLLTIDELVSLGAENLLTLRERAETEFQEKILDEALISAKKETAPYLPMFRPRDWFEPGTKVVHLYHINMPRLSRGAVSTVHYPLLDVDEGMGPQNRPRYHAESALVMRVWERNYFYNHPDVAMTWTRVINALTPDKNQSGRHYILLAALVSSSAM